MEMNILRWAKAMKKVHWVLMLSLTGFMFLMFRSPNALAQLKGTDIFDERPKAGSFDAESRIDAIKRERIESQRQGVVTQRKTFESEMESSCSCVLNKIGCPFRMFHLTSVPLNPYSGNNYRGNERKYRQWEDKQRAAEEARKHSVPTKSEIESSRRAQESAEKKRKLCVQWKDRGSNEESESFRRQIQVLNNQIQQEAAVESRLASERRARYADQMMQKYANEQKEKDNIQLELKRQRDAENERRRLQYLKSQQETAANLERQKASCRAEVARKGYPDSCGCQALLNWPPSSNKNASCGK